MSEDERLVGEIKRNDDNILRFSIKEYKGRKYCDIRVYFKNGRGHMIPTKKGITLSRKNITMAMHYLDNAQLYLNGEDPF